MLEICTACCLMIRIQQECSAKLMLHHNLRGVLIQFKLLLFRKDVDINLVICLIMLFYLWEFQFKPNREYRNNFSTEITMTKRGSHRGLLFQFQSLLRINFLISLSWLFKHNMKCQTSYRKVYSQYSIGLFQGKNLWEN